jgi:hypothetical protein
LLPGKALSLQSPEVTPALIVQVIPEGVAVIVPEPLPEPVMKRVTTTAS